jgi:hypothetical protein
MSIQSTLKHLRTFSVAVECTYSVSIGVEPGGVADDRSADKLLHVRLIALHAVRVFGCNMHVLKQVEGGGQAMCFPVGVHLEQQLHHVGQELSLW